MNVLLVYGGESSEHEVSKISAKFVCQSLLTARHTVYLCGITKNGDWLLQASPLFEDPFSVSSVFNSLLDGKELTIQEPVDKQEAKKRTIFIIASQGIWKNTHNPEKLSIDIVFPLVHGYFGEDGTLQHMLDVAKIPYVGCNAVSSMYCMNKHLTKKILRHHNIPVLPDITVCSDTIKDVVQHSTQSNDIYSLEQIAQHCIDNLGISNILVKPNNNGSSVGISVIQNKESLQRVLIDCAQYGDYILLEPFLQQKREIEVSVIGNDTHTIKSFPPGEIILHEGNMYDYTLKYHSIESQVSLQVPASLESKTEKIIRDYAEKVYLTLGCSGYARIDFFLYNDDMQKECIVINEINTIPGFTDISMFPKLIMNTGIQATELINTIIALALKKHL